MDYVKVTISKTGNKIHVLPHEAEVLVNSGLAVYGHEVIEPKEVNSVEESPENKVIEPKEVKRGRKPKE